MAHKSTRVIMSIRLLLLFVHAGVVVHASDANATVDRLIEKPGGGSSVKKDLKVPLEVNVAGIVTKPEGKTVSQQNAVQHEPVQQQLQPKQETLDISESPTINDVNNQQMHSAQTSQQQNQQPTTAESKEVHIEKTHYQQPFLPDEIPDVYKAGFYFFFGISSAAILFIIVRVYRLRLSRAERKYGVQGDRSNQELTPLPMAFEDANSDEDDHTLFEINRQQIRIL